jgi:hypothetical protein
MTDYIQFGIRVLPRLMEALIAERYFEARINNNIHQ